MKGVSKDLVTATTRAAIFWEGSSVIVGEGYERGGVKGLEAVSSGLVNYSAEPKK
ncbi:MAG TPA: hypothetical protein PLX30_07040 [Methanothrix sp.]|nr:hypothetical protein [Methanothrix sp.]